VRDFGQHINVQGWTQPRLRAVICWWGNRCLFGKDDRHHMLTSWAEPLFPPCNSMPTMSASSTVILIR